MVHPTKKYNNLDISLLENNEWIIFLTVTLNLNFAQITRAQGQDILKGHKQTLYQITASNNFPLQNMT